MVIVPRLACHILGQEIAMLGNFQGKEHTHSWVSLTVRTSENTLHWHVFSCALFLAFSGLIQICYGCLATCQRKFAPGQCTLWRFQCTWVSQLKNWGCKEKGTPRLPGQMVKYDQVTMWSSSKCWDWIALEKYVSSCFWTSWAGWTGNFGKLENLKWPCFTTIPDFKNTKVLSLQITQLNTKWFYVAVTFGEKYEHFINCKV